MLKVLPLRKKKNIKKTQKDHDYLEDVQSQQYQMQVLGPESPRQ